jgi:hypothetical protein
LYAIDIRLAVMARQQTDYSVYLVTDSTAAILGDKDLVSVVAAAVRGGKLDSFDGTRRIALASENSTSC